MKFRKDLVIVALAAFCLTATLFMIIPTKSNPETSNYDAWNDLNDDGTIDIYDAINFAGTFNTAGDPTKNVNVTNWPAAQPNYKYVQGTAVNCSWTNTGVFSPLFQIVGVAGFSRAYLYVTSLHLSQASPGNYTVSAQIGWVTWLTSTDTWPRAWDTENMDYTGVNNFDDHVDILVYNGQVVNVYPQQFNRNWGLDVKGPYLRPTVFCNASVPSGWVMIEIEAYLRNE
jgi:hypothetical protein